MEFFFTSSLIPDPSSLLLIFFSLLLNFYYVVFGEEISAHVFVEDRINAAQIFKPHHGVLYLFVSVVLKNAAQLFVTGSLRALIIPVNGFEFFLNRFDRARKIERFLAHLR